MYEAGVIPSWESVLSQSSPLICGIHNVTPDSFSDGGEYLDDQSNTNHLSVLIEHGAHVIDVGAESTRPGAHEVSDEEEQRRLTKTFEFVAASSNDVLFSIDTRHASTARSAVQSGFHIVNDVSAGSFDPEMIDSVVELGALFVAMHSRGTPETMKDLAVYDNVVDDVIQDLNNTVENLVSKGMNREKIMVDLGIGFAKNAQDSITLMNNAQKVKEQLGLPLMVGVSRKSVIGHMLTVSGQEDSLYARDELTARVCADLVEQGVDAVRVHNVFETAQKINHSK